MKNYFLALRPKQWLKNVFVLAALIFAKQIFNWSAVGQTVLALVIFCLLASAGYLINDLVDLEKDKFHPVKSKRPIPSGKIKPAAVIIYSLVLAAAGLFLAGFLGINFLVVALIYVFLHIFYTFFLKELVIIDLLMVAVFYVLRVIAGGVAINVYVSPWLLICTFFLALFIAVSKRRHELVLLQEEAYAHRTVLKEYTPQLLDQMLAMVTPATLVAYSLYTFTSGKSANLIFTIPFVVYGLFRYLYLVFSRDEGGEPSEILINDLPLKISILLWAAGAVLIFYYF